MIYLAHIVEESVASQVADHLLALHFDCADSLYLSSRPESGFIVGPTVSTPFYRTLDGFVRIPNADAISYSALVVHSQIPLITFRAS